MDDQSNRLLKSSQFVFFPIEIFVERNPHFAMFFITFLIFILSPKCIAGVTVLFLNII